jgi:hypothetical protein
VQACLPVLCGNLDTPKLFLRAAIMLSIYVSIYRPSSRLQADNQCIPHHEKYLKLRSCRFTITPPGSEHLSPNVLPVSPRRNTLRQFNWYIADSSE